MPKPLKLKMVADDPWLEPAAEEVNQRYARFRSAFDRIRKEWGGLLKFADAYNYFGIHYDRRRKGWVYREWAPKAQDLYLFGDFNNWQRTSHRMTRDKYGVWEIFLEKEKYKG